MPAAFFAQNSSATQILISLRTSIVQTQNQLYTAANKRQEIKTGLLPALGSNTPANSRMTQMGYFSSVVPFQYSEAGELTEASDKQLFKLVKGGDSTAFEVLFNRYETRLVGYAMRYLPCIELAKDTCQEVFVKLITKPPKILLSDSLAPWLFRVTRNLAIDKCRSRKFEVFDDSTAGEAVDTNNPHKDIRHKSDLELLRQLVDELPPNLKEVVNLRIDDEVSFKEISDSLNIPQGTALWRMHRALEVLREEWRKHGHKM